VIARLLGLAADARAVTRTNDAIELAGAGSWIARNLLAIRRSGLVVETALPPQPHRLGVRPLAFADLVAALAAVPALVDPVGLPARWWLSLRALGIPMLDRPVRTALAAGASVLTVQPAVWSVHVTPDHRGYHVRVTTSPRMLAA
jgi:hypothetical protein